MTSRAAVAIAAAAALLAACGNDSCPTAAGTPQTGQTPSCTGTPQQVQITLQLCEACSHTAPTCSAQLNDLANGNIFLDTRWEVCTDNSSCAARACGNATCQFSVPSRATPYKVLVLSGQTTGDFDLSVTNTSASCSGTI